MPRRSTPPMCPTCTAPTREGQRWCRICGNRLNPARWRGWAFRLVALAVVVAFLASARLLFTTLWNGDVVQAAAPESETSTTAAPATLPAEVMAGPATSAAPPPPPTAEIRPAGAAASNTAGDSQNSCGETTVYSPSYLLDGDYTTGWRTKGDGTGETISFAFAGPTRLGQVGLVPGYAKIDPCNGADRFRQLRREVAVRWSFDNGVTVDQQFTEEPAMQMIGVDVVTTTATIEILDVTENPEIDHTPISEVSFLGAPA